jgi:hypothetical protein
MQSCSAPTDDRPGVRHVLLDDDGRYTLAPAPEPGFDGMLVFWWRDRPAHRPVSGAKSEPAAGRIDSDGLARIAAEEAQAAPARLDASVLICTRDRPDELRRCLASLPQQTLRPREVIVIDNASRDGRTREVALAAGAIYLREDRPGLDIARNAGARRATSSPPLHARACRGVAGAVGTACRCENACCETSQRCPRAHACRAHRGRVAGRRDGRSAHGSRRAGRTLARVRRCRYVTHRPPGYVLERPTRRATHAVRI